MNRQQKVEVVNFLQDNFSKNAASILIDFQGLTVGQLQKLRGELRKTGSILKIAKARLVKLAIEDKDGGQDLLPFCKNQIGLVFADTDTPAAAKVLQQFSKEHEALKIIAGCLDSHVLDAASIVRLANLPSKDVLRAQLCGTLNMPMVSFVNVLNILILRLLWVLKKIGEEKQS
jgi:large subunit ribosomal protein L10